ncbi:kinase-like domain-containing protein [Gigaspora rosea]|uniref:Kinase-like domain-containing protein n=1 Tax=Gigaspora rosea TaxID=44941 RepID=A0A397W0S8_9GLOM|nr:kinase-like domain-containing protein [Gigaspora rosea]
MSLKTDKLDYKADNYYMVLQYADSGDLEHYLNAHFSELDWSTKIRMAKEISSGIDCLHSANIVHRDLHDKNILVHGGRMIITDFGLSLSLDSVTLSITSRVYGRCEYSYPLYSQVRMNINGTSIQISIVLVFFFGNCQAE